MVVSLSGDVKEECEAQVKSADAGQFSCLSYEWENRRKAFRTTKLFWWFRHNFSALREWYDRHHEIAIAFTRWRRRMGIDSPHSPNPSSFIIALTEKNRNNRKRFNVSLGRVWWAVGRWCEIHFVIKICYH